MSKTQVQSFNKIANPDKFITNKIVTKGCKITPLCPKKDNL